MHPFCSLAAGRVVIWSREQVWHCRDGRQKRCRNNSRRSPKRKSPTALKQHSKFYTDSNISDRSQSVSCYWTEVSCSCGVSWD